ncbi:MAG: hypothetical protein LBK47_08390 [Prevotellaceae bacterium]|jgi:hypothetical protein|nr:hypothetical protein [Prevotellaceae bacterium]
MTPKELEKKLESIPIAPTIFGKTATDFFTENFDRQVVIYSDTRGVLVILRG